MSEFWLLMAVLYCKQSGQIREGAGTFSDETSSMDENRIFWKTRGLFCDTI